MNKKVLIFVILVLIMGAVTAGVIYLFPYDPTNPPKVDFSGYTEQGVKDVVYSNNKFAFDFYNKLNKDSNQNIFFSPHSIYSAFSMVYEGSANQTKQEIKNVFNFQEPELLAPNFAKVYSIINKDDKDYTLRIGNALWIDNNFDILDNYATRIEKYYGGKSVNLDFINDTENSRININEFISQQTNSMIPELLPQGIITPETKLVLTNAIYFEGSWKLGFKTSNTEKKQFHADNGVIFDVEMMTLTSDEIKDSKINLKYVDLNDSQILEFPYKSDLSMVLILPTTTIDSLGDINIDKYNEWIARLDSSTHKIEYISFPKFEFDTDYSLKKYLVDMGMLISFTGSADFSKISNDVVFISDAIHKAYIKVDEEGTKAAASTAVIMKGISAMMPEYRDSFIANHPFIFVIKENSTGEILFLGKVETPSP